MNDVVPGNPFARVVSMRMLGWIQFALATPVVLWEDGRSLFADGNLS